MSEDRDRGSDECGSKFIIYYSGGDGECCDIVEVGNSDEAMDLARQSALAEAEMFGGEPDWDVGPYSKEQAIYCRLEKAQP